MKVDSRVGGVLETRYSALLIALDDFVRSNAPRIEQDDARDALTELDGEYANIAHLMDVSLDASEGDTDSLLRLYLQLCEYLTLRGLSLEKFEWGMALMRKLASASRRVNASLINNIANAHDEMGNHEAAIGLYRLLAERDGQPLDDDRLADFYLNLGAALRADGKQEEAERYLQRAVGAYRRLGDTRGLIRALMNLSSIHYERWEMADSLNVVREAVDRARAISDRVLLAQCTSSLALVMVGNLMFDEAEPIYEEALDLLSNLGNDVDIARTQFNYALLLRLLKRPGEAMHLAEESLGVLERYRLPEAGQVRRNLEKWRSEQGQADA